MNYCTFVCNIFVITLIPNIRYYVNTKVLIVFVIGMGAIHYKILKEKGLLIQKFSGEFTKNDLAFFFTELYNNPDYLSVSYIFSDFTHAVVALSDDEIVEVAYFIMDRAPKVQMVINAILVDEPLVTAYSVLYKEVMKKMPLYKCEIFSTFNEAARYVRFNATELKNIIRLAFTS